MSGANVPNPYNPVSDFGSWLGFAIANTDIGFSAMFGKPTDAQIQTGRDQVGATMAQAGATIEQQQAAKDEYTKQLGVAAANFDKNNRLANVFQRAWDAAIPQTSNPDPFAILGVDESNFLDLSGVATTATSWALIIGVGVALVALYFVMESL
jgi:hypothetical protein